MVAALTLAERKRARVEEIRGGVARLKHELARYARTRHGRFWLYGSAAVDRLQFDSDVDILVDFNAAELSAAMDFVESICMELGLKADAQPKAWCKPAFLQRIGVKAQFIE